MAVDSAPEHNGAPTPHANGSRTKLHGRAFYESIGSPKVILAPMVDQSEFAWRMLSRSFMPSASKKSLLAYTPMFHARLFADNPKYRETAFQPLKTAIPDPPCSHHQSQHAEADAHLDGNASIDRPLFVQFCANDADCLLKAARLVQPYCDAVDLNLGCPQGIARKGHYGAFLQEDWELIFKLINTLHEGLDIPVTAKMRILETPEKTLEYAKMILSAGASILTVHGRQRHQKGHNTGVAEWSVIRYLREQLPEETVLFANGNILQHGDIGSCLEATGADGIMSAEGNLHDPTIFAPLPNVGQEGREYWRDREGKGGYRMDAVMRRYLDVIYEHVLQQPLPERKPLFIASDPRTAEDAPVEEAAVEDEEEEPPKKKQKKGDRTSDPNLTAMQAHLFNMLRPLITKHTHVRDALARSRAGDIAAFEKVLALVEKATREGIIEYEDLQSSANGHNREEEAVEGKDVRTSSREAVERCRRPWWICQPYIRPLPDEALAKGALKLSSKDRKKLAMEENGVKESEGKVEAVSKENTSVPQGKTEVVSDEAEKEQQGKVELVRDEVSKDQVEIPKDGLVCG